MCSCPISLMVGLTRDPIKDSLLVNCLSKSAQKCAETMKNLTVRYVFQYNKLYLTVCCFDLGSKVNRYKGKQVGRQTGRMANR